MALQTSDARTRLGIAVTDYSVGTAIANAIDLGSAGYKITLTAGTETDNAIDVVGAVTNLDGTVLTAAVQVLIRSLADWRERGVDDHGHQRVVLIQVLERRRGRHPRSRHHSRRAQPATQIDLRGVIAV